MGDEVKAGWPSMRLDQVAELCLGKMLDKEKNRGEPRPYLANMNVRWGSFELHDLREMRFEERELERYGLRFGDIVMCEGGEPGRCAIWTDEVPGMMIQKALHRIRPKEGIDSHYLFYALAQGAQSGSFDEYMTGSGIRHLPGNQVAKLEVLMPPLDEQQRIAEVLRSVDETIAAADRASLAAQHVFSSMRAELLDGARASSEEVLVLDAIAKNRGQRLIKLQTSDYLDEGEFPIIDQGASFVCGFTNDADAVWPYDLPVIVFGDHTRILKFVDFPFVIGADGTQCITPAPNFDAKFLYFTLQSLDLRGEGYARHFKLLKERHIPMPTLVEQVEIAEQLASLEKVIEQAETATERLLVVKRAIMSDLLSGRVRVPA